MLLTTLVGLICNYKQERRASEDQNHARFIEWLGSHRHEALKDLIANSYHLQSEVTALLQEDHELMIGKLGDIERLLATLLSRFDGFSQLAKTLHPEWELSEQALEIFKAFVKSESRFMITIQTNDGLDFGFVGSNGQVSLSKPKEPRFFEDDMVTLVALGLLSQEYGSTGDPRYQLTRAGHLYAQTLS